MARGFWQRLWASTLQGTEPESGCLDEDAARQLEEAGHVRRHYYCSGRVQEVGFRYTAFYLAQELGLTGWVGNLADGRVELELQGPAEKVDALLIRIGQRGRIVLEHIEEEERPLCWEHGFKVKG